MARTKSTYVPVGVKVFGKARGQITNLNTWEKHDHKPHWTTDNGKGETFGIKLGQIIDNAIAKETKDAVRDYAGDAEFGISVIEGRLYERCRLYNSAASIVTQVDIVEQLLTTIRECKANIADDQSRHMLSSIKAVIARLDKELVRNSVEREPEPEADVDASSSFSDLDQFN